jgi:hypothetical protein
VDRRTPEALIGPTPSFYACTYSGTDLGYPLIVIATALAACPVIE